MSNKRCGRETMDRFADLTSAGLRLAQEVQQHCGSDPIVLGIANGGVPVAAALAHKLTLPLDIAVIRRLFTPRGPMFPVCAFNIAGTLVIDPEVEIYETPTSPAAHFVNSALKELAQRAQTCRDGQPATMLRGREIILVDNGIQTGSTITAVIRALRSLKPCRIIVAVPVAAAEVRVAVEQISDRFVCLSLPENIGHVALWYTDFTRPSDDQVRDLYRSSFRRTIMLDRSCNCVSFEK